jgi:hypothetical protein
MGECSLGVCENFSLREPNCVQFLWKHIFYLLPLTYLTTCVNACAHSKDVVFCIAVVFQC